MKLVLFIVIGFIVWRIVRAMMSKTPTALPPAREPQHNERVAPRAPEIDYTRVRDAEWREGDPIAQPDRVEKQRGDSGPPVA